MFRVRLVIFASSHPRTEKKPRRFVVANHGAPGQSLGNKFTEESMSELTEGAGHFDAGSRREQTLSALSACQTRLVQQFRCVVMMEGVFAGGVVSIVRNALEAVDSFYSGR